MASWTCSACRIGMLGRLTPLARCPPAWAPLKSHWAPDSSNGSTVRCFASQPDRLPPPDVRKLAQLAQIAVTDEQVRCPPPPLSAWAHTSASPRKQHLAEACVHALYSAARHTLLSARSRTGHR